MRLVLLLPLPIVLSAQDPKADGFELHGQATTITDAHAPFSSPYEGLNSLRPVREINTSLTVTLFARFRYRNTEIGFDGEVAGGKGFSGVAGIAGFPNGEIPRVAKPMPTPYIARVFVKQKVSRFSWVLGKVAATDFFDGNAYSHDPRTQFENWSIMDNGAWDYPADVRGYSIGVVQEIQIGPSILRAGSFLEPVSANGPRLDGHFTANRGDTFEWQYDYREGSAVRMLGFVNRANMGKYRDAVQDIVATRGSGRVKYGFGLNLQHKIASEIGVFGRLGWNDGKTESWAFTEIDRTGSGGVSIRGDRWRRPDDTFGAAFAVNGISGDHRAYLARGGYGFIIGDGTLPNPGLETVFETYYACRLWPAVTLSPDYQFIANPAYNRDRGPVSVVSLRLHVER